MFTRRSLLGRAAVAPLAGLTVTPVRPSPAVYVRPGEPIPFDLDDVKASVNTILHHPDRFDPAAVGDLHRMVLKAIALGRGDPVTLAQAALNTEEIAAAGF